MKRILHLLRRDPLRKYDLKPGEPFGESGSWAVAPDGMSLLPAPQVSGDCLGHRHGSCEDAECGCNCHKLARAFGDAPLPGGAS